MFLAEISILQIMGNFTNSSYAPLAHFIKGSFLLNEAAVGLITSAAFAGSMAVSLLSGLIVDSLGPKRTMKISYGVMAGGALLAYFSYSYVFLVSAYFIIGFGYGMVTPATNSSIMDEYYPHHSSPMGIKQSGVPMGTIFATIALPLLVLHYSLRLAFLSLFVITGIIGLLIRGEKNYRRGQSSREKVLKNVRVVLHNRTLLAISAITAFLSWGQQAVFTYFVLFLTSRNFYVLVAENLFIVLLVGSVAGRILWPSITQRLFNGHRMKNYAFIIVLTGLAFLALPNFASSLLEAGIMSMIMGFTAVAWNSNYVTIISEIAPKGKVGTYSGMSMMIISFGSIIGAPFSGYIVDTTGTFSTMWMVLGVTLVAVSFILIMVSGRLPGAGLRDPRNVESARLT